MKEGLNLEGARKIWRARLEQRLPLVKREIERRQSQKPLQPCVADTCPEKYVELASRLVALQIAKGEYQREDIPTSDMNKIKDFGKARGLSFIDSIAVLVEDNAYFNKDVIEARHIISLLDEFDEIYDRIKDQTPEFPMNLLGYDNRKWLLRHNNGLSHSEKMKEVLGVYRPELASLEIVDLNYEMLPRSRQTLSADEVEAIKTQLAKLADENGSVDMIFDEKHEALFNVLCQRLKATGYTFDKFLERHTEYSYTPCYRGEILSAVKLMALEYQRKFNSLKGMTNQDPYLRYKVESAQEVVRAHSTRDFFNALGIPNDCYDYDSKTLSHSELRRREEVFLKKMQELYPDGKIADSFTKHERLYDELTMLASRFDYEGIDAYLTAHGFERQVKYTKPEDRTIYLSEFDIMYYRFFVDCKTPDDIARKCEELKLAKVDPAENLKLYRRLICQKQDVRQKLSTSEQEKLFAGASK